MKTKGINWGTRNDFDCVIICGGQGTRMLPMTFERQKTVLAVQSRPVLAYLVDYWRSRCARFHFVAHHRAEQVEEFVRTLDLPCDLIVEEKAEGIARALARTRDRVGSHFVTVLGDCLCNGQFYFPGEMDQGLGVTSVSNPLAIHQSYAVRNRRDWVTEVIEKPVKLVNNDCGMGVYFFSREVFDHIDATPPSARTGKIEITDVIQHMIAAGRPVRRVWFNGDYVNITYPEDLVLAGKIAERMNRRATREEAPVYSLPPEAIAPLRDQEHADRLLLFRTIPMGMFRQVVRFVRATRPGARIDVLCQPQAADAVKGIEGVDGVQLFPGDGLFRLGLSSRPFIRRLREGAYDIAVLPYNNPSRTGYLGLELLAQLASRQTYGIFPPSRMFVLNWWNVAPIRRLGIMRAVERLVYWGLRAAMGARRALRARSVPAMEKA